MEPNHNHDHSSGAELPQLEEINTQTDGTEQSASAPETRSKQPPAVTGLNTTMPTVSAQLTPTGNMAAPVPAASTVQASSMTADDADLIEKEWVLKAKAIVMQTKDDPRKQNIEMNGVKADYLKKRYNKDLKVSES